MLCRVHKFLVAYRLRLSPEFAATAQTLKEEERLAFTGRALNTSDAAMFDELVVADCDNDPAYAAAWSGAYRDPASGKPPVGVAFLRWVLNRYPGIFGESYFSPRALTYEPVAPTDPAAPVGHVGLWIGVDLDLFMRVLAAEVRRFSRPADGSACPSADKAMVFPPELWSRKDLRIELRDLVFDGHADYCLNWAQVAALYAPTAKVVLADYAPHKDLNQDIGVGFAIADHFGVMRRDYVHRG